MGLSRSQRRMIAKKRRNLALCDAINSAAVTARQETVKSNLSRPARRENSRGLVFDYSPAVKPVGFTRPMRFSKGPVYG